MEIQQILTLLFTAVAVVLGVLILVKVNELITMLRTPIVKKLSPDMNLKPSSRHSIGAQEMASRGDRNTKDNRSNPNRDRSVVNKDSNRPDRPDRGERNDRPDRGMGQNRDRNNDRRNDRRNNNNRGDVPTVARISRMQSSLRWKHLWLLRQLLASLNPLLYHHLQSFIRKVVVRSLRACL
jgi:hypothetical protein